jgi:quercetin dioxygenase-like cupin family protein
MKMVSLNDLPEEGVSHDPDLMKKIMIRQGQLPHLKSFAQLRMIPGQIAHAHAHEHLYEIFLIETGEGTLDVEGRQYKVSAGTCVTFEPSEVHEVANTGSEELVLTYFGLEV